MTNLTAVAVDIGSGTASSDAVTINKPTGIVTTESKTTAQNGNFTITVTCSYCKTGSFVLVDVWNGTNTQGTVTKGKVTPGNGSFTVEIRNTHASAEALNGTVKFGFRVENPQV